MNESTSAKIIVYGTPTCPMVPPVRALLDRAGAAYEYINISSDSAARARVLEINGGYASVPTLAFPDGDTLTEPKLRELEAKLRASGLEIPPATLRNYLRLLGSQPTLMLVSGISLILGLIGGETALIAAGASIAAVIMLGRVFGQ